MSKRREKTPMLERNWFDRANETLIQVENSAVNLASTIVPWLTPIAPMVMTFNHTINILGWAAYPVAAVVELLGFAAISTLVKFYLFNKRNRAEYKKAPTWAIVFSFLFYLSLILATNVALDMWPNNKNVEVIVRGFFTLQTIPGAVIVVVRAAHREMLEEVEREKSRSRTEANSSENGTPNKTKKANIKRTFASLNETDREFIVSKSTEEAAKKFSVTDRAIQKWRIRILETWEKSGKAV